MFAQRQRKRQKKLDLAPVRAKEAKIEAPVNFHCKLCTVRLYPVRNFFRPALKEKKIPILVLHFNGNFRIHPPLATKRDLSTQNLFGTKEEDQLFERMLNKLSLGTQNFYYQEFPACHFNANRSVIEDWQQRAKHCTKHVQSSIQKYDIKRIILCGPAAVALLGEEKAKQRAKDATLFSVSFGERTLDCVSLRSPASLLELERYRNQEKDKQKHDIILEKEKAIKNGMLKAVQSIVGLS